MNRDDPNSSDANTSADPSKDDLRTEGRPRTIEDGDRADTDRDEQLVTDNQEDDRFEAGRDEGTGRAAGRWLRVFGLFLALLAVLAAAAIFAGRHHVRNAMRENLPQLDGRLKVYGLAAPVTVERDVHSVPHIRANSMDDLVFAQGFVTAQDRLWQMDLLRRHAAGELAAILGRSMLEHDRLQRMLQIRASADRAIAALPADQRHWMEVYARGVNASIAAQRAHLPVEFRLLGYQPVAWTPRDSILVELVMFQGPHHRLSGEAGSRGAGGSSLTGLDRRSLPRRLLARPLPKPPAPDVSAPQPEFNDIPLDESQSKLRQPSPANISANDLLALRQTLALFRASCDECVAGSNAWAVSGARTASGKPLLSNDMHLSLSVPELWYEADLEAAKPAPLADFHAAGVTLPGTPFIIAGHNDHVAWGFTNLGADVQGLYYRAHPWYPERSRVPDYRRDLETSTLPDRSHPGARRRQRDAGCPAHSARRHGHTHRQ